MKNILKRVFKTVGLLLGLFLLYVLVIIVCGTIFDYQPEAKISLSPEQNASLQELNDSILTIAIWNVGYGGLGAESDFFYDNGGLLFSKGHMIRSPRSYVEKNMEGVKQFINDHPHDFYLFQEIDVHSRRSYCINQFQKYQEMLPAYSAIYAANYKVDRVPIPICEPWRAYGKVDSGLATYAKFQPTSSARLQLPGSFSWPTSIFQLDRCIAFQRFALAWSEKELVVMNVHLSAYDDGTIKKQQMTFLQEQLLAEYEKGNYVIVGGDWNLCPPGFQFDAFFPGDSKGYFQYNINEDFVPAAWQWAYDPNTPSNRKNRTTYVPGETFETMIDFYLLSPNITLREVKGIKQSFNFSDHQPVHLEVALD